MVCAAAKQIPVPAKQIPVIDTHIHLFDPTRPGGVPWPTKDDPALFKPALPPRYVELSARHGVVGAIAIEASPLGSDNDWLLKVVEGNPVMVGMIGDLIPGSSGYMADLDRLRKNPLFLGIRYGNLWDRDLSVDLGKRGFADGLRALARAGLVFESANPDGKLIAAVLKVSELTPDLRVVVDHLPHAVVPAGATERSQYLDHLRALAQNPHVFVKLSEIPLVVNGALVTDPAAYTEHLNEIWELFGEDHILFGSDWPNSDHVAPYDATFSIVRQYISGKGTAAAEKYFWKNSIAAYRWRPRRANQYLASI
jgi:predicted TIM-barrel fold metal-dependent hydrolase